MDLSREDSNNTALGEAGLTQSQTCCFIPSGFCARYLSQNLQHTGKSCLHFLRPWDLRCSFAQSAEHSPQSIAGPQKSLLPDCFCSSYLPHWLVFQQCSFHSSLCLSSGPQLTEYSSRGTHD